MSHNEQLSKPKYRNWVRGGLATKYVREGLAGFVEETSKQHHDDMLLDIQKKYGVSATSGCNKCSIKKLLPMHSKDQNGRCPLNQRSCICGNVQGRQLCPSKFCSAMYDKIIVQHRFFSPNWKNTDIQQWHSNHWQIAKCNIPGVGYESKTSAAEIDCSGLIGVIINGLAQQNAIDCTIDPPHDVFSKTRKARDEIFHSPDMELDEATLKEYIDDMIAILDDKKLLCNRSEAIVAKKKLYELRNDSFIISNQDADEMRKLALEAIDEKTKEALQSIDGMQEEHKTRIQKTEEQIKELAEKQANLSTKQELQAHRTDLANAKGEIKSIQECLSKLSTKENYEEQKNCLTTMNGQIEELEKSMSEMVTKSDLKQQKDAVSSISNELSKLNDTVNDLQTATDNSKFAEKLANTQDHIETLKYNIDCQQSSIDLLSKQVPVKDKITEDTCQQLQKNYLEISKKVVQLQQELIKIKQEKEQKLSEDENKLTYEERKQSLQCDLIEIYKKYLTKVSVQPMIPDEEADVTDIFVKPDMVIEGRDEMMSKFSCVKGDSSFKPFFPVLSYKEMFYTGREKNYKIYISGDAGMGKSTFCKLLISKWCKLHTSFPVTSQYENEYFQTGNLRKSDQVQDAHDSESQSDEDDIDIIPASSTEYFYDDSDDCPAHYADEFEGSQVLQEYDFLFFISLRHVKRDYHIHDMIKTQLLGGTSHMETLEQVLANEADLCLIILDGLDEWNPVTLEDQDFPDHQLQNRNIPQLNVMSKYTVLTTTRPWKIEAVRLKKSAMDIHLKLLGFSEEAESAFIIKALNHLNREYNRCKTYWEFMHLLTDRQLQEISSVPILLLQLLCLWHDDKPLGNTLCDTYSNMINLLFEVNKSPVPTSSGPELDLPKCLLSNKKCKEYRHLLFKLAKVSFELLFPKDSSKPPTLVFERSDAESCGMTWQEIDTCLKIGILTESKVIGKYASERHTSLAFLHATFQEFLAAVFISMNDHSDDKLNINDQIFSKCDNMYAILGMEKLFIFVVVMNPPRAKQLSRCIQMVLEQSDEVMQYRSALNRKDYQHVYSNLHSIQNLILSCIWELQHADEKYPLDSCMHLGDITAVEQFYDVKKFGYVEQVPAFKMQRNIKDLLLYIDTEYTKSVNIETDNELSDIFIEHFSKCRSLQKLYIHSRHKRNLLQLAVPLILQSNESLISLCLNTGIMYMMGTETATLNIPAEIPLLQTVRLKGIDFCHKDLENVISFLENAHHLKELHLHNMDCVEHRVNCPLKLQLLSSQILQVFDIAAVHIGLSVKSKNLKHCSISTTPKIIHGVVSNFQWPSSIQVLKIHKNTRGIGLMKLMQERKLLPGNEGETAVNEVNTYSSDTIQLLTELIPNLYHLTKLDLFGLDFEDKTLNISNKLRNVGFNYVTFVEDKMKELIEYICSVNHSMETIFTTCKIKQSAKSEGGPKKIWDIHRLKVTTKTVVVDEHDDITETLHIEHKNPKEEESEMLYACLTQNDAFAERLHGLKVHHDSFSDEIINPKVVETLVNSIPRFHMLEKLKLEHIDFADKVLSLNTEMRILKHIELVSCTMNDSAFKEFLNSVPRSEHSLKIDVMYASICVRTDNEIPLNEWEWDLHDVIVDRQYNSDLRGQHSIQFEISHNYNCLRK